MEQKQIKQVLNLDEAIEFYLEHKQGKVNCVYGKDEKIVDHYQDAADFFLSKEKENKIGREENNGRN